MSSPLADTMRSCNAVGNHQEAVAWWCFVHDPGIQPSRPPENLDELFQLVTALSTSGYVSRALNITHKYPRLFQGGKMGGDVLRVLGIGQLIQGNVNEAIEYLEAAIRTREAEDDPRLALDLVGLARAYLIKGELDEASEQIEGAAAIVETADNTLMAPTTLHVSYWHTVVNPAATGTVDIVRASRVSATDRALHRRKVAQQLLRARKPEAVAWGVVQREHALPTRGIIFRRPLSENDDPWGWFLSFK